MCTERTQINLIPLVYITFVIVFNNCIIYVRCIVNIIKAFLILKGYVKT